MEFVTATINRELVITNERLESTFKLFDKDGNGVLNATELK